MEDFTRCTCPIRYNECEYTEEFERLTAAGWEVEKAMYDPENMCVRFILTKEHDTNAGN